MERHESQPPLVPTEQFERQGFEDGHMDAGQTEILELARTANEAQEAEGNEMPAGEASVSNGQTSSREDCTSDSRLNDLRIEEDETQLVAIRELMTRASVRGIWLTLGDIAEATEFAEASISAQLRHLRKVRNGGYHVEKRHRRARRANPAIRKSRSARRSPITWEYRVLPPA